MYATAQQVSRQGKAGINAFLYEHGKGFTWPADPSRLPEENPGRLARQHIELPPGNNPVHAYLDVLAPDGTPPALLREALETFHQDILERSNPTTFAFRRVTLRFGVQLSLELYRREMLKRLIAAIGHVLPT